MAYPTWRWPISSATPSVCSWVTARVALAQRPTTAPAAAPAPSPWPTSTATAISTWSTANLNAATVSVLLGNGKGGFAAKIDHKTYDDPQTLAVGDFNGDDIPDLVVADEYGPDTVSVLLGNGKGGFGPEREYRARDFPGSFAVADFNGDGKPDLAVANLNGSVSVLLGNGKGGFATRPITTSATTKRVRWPRATSMETARSIWLWPPATPTSSACCRAMAPAASAWAPPLPSALTRSSYSMSQSIAVGDLNGDGRTDLVVSNGLLNKVDVFFGEPGATATAGRDGLWYFHLCGATASATSVLCQLSPAHRHPQADHKGAGGYGGARSHREAALRGIRPSTLRRLGAGGGDRQERARRDRSPTHLHPHSLGWCTATFRCTLAKRTYRYYVYATDVAGNRQNKVAGNRLTVR